MPDDNKEEKAASGESGVMKGIEEILSLLKPLVAAMSGGAAPAPTGGPGEMPAGPEGAGGPGGLSEQELDELLEKIAAEHGSGGGEESPEPEPEPEGSRKEEPVSQNSSATPGGDNTYIPSDVAKLQREVRTLSDQLLRRETEARFSDLKNQGYQIDVADETSFVMRLPPEAREDYIGRVSKNARKAPIMPGMHPAIGASEVGAAKGTRDPETQSRIIKLARQENISYEAAAEKCGITLR